MKKVLLSFSIFLCYGIQCPAQENRNFSGLKNRELRQCPGSNRDVKKNMDKELNSGSSLPAWPPAAGQPASSSEPRIDRVIITEDREMECRGEITFSGLSAGTMQLRVLGMDGNLLEGIHTVTMQVSASSGLLDMHSQLDINKVAANSLLNAGYMKLQFQPASGDAGTEFCFVFPKKWKALQRNENITVDLTAQPFKTSAGLLTQTESLPVPGSQAGTEVKKPGSQGIPVKPVKPNPVSKEKKDSLDRTQKGVSNIPLSLFDMVRSDVAFSSPADISTILLSNIYHDKNQKSGVFYYLPVSYNLSWNEQSGFNFKTLYTKATGATDGSVNMIASLSPGITQGEHAFAREFLAEYMKDRPEIYFTELTAILPSEPKISLQGTLQSLYDIRADKITTSVSSSIYEPVTASWAANTDAANEILTALGQGVGISGDMSFKAEANEATAFSVPVKIGLANEYTFGSIGLAKSTFRTQMLTNTFPYPIKVMNLHVLVFNRVNGKFIPCIYTWKLGDKVVLPKSRMRMDATAVPAWLDTDTRVKKIWIEYDLQPCESCTEAVINSVSSGTSGDRTRFIKFNSMGVIGKYNMSFMKIIVRSRFFDPKGKAVLERSFTVTQDNSDTEAGPFYAWNEKDLSYEYRIALLNEEKTYEGTDWIPSKEYELFINKDVVKRSLGNNTPPAK